MAKRFNRHDDYKLLWSPGWDHGTEKDTREKIRISK